MRTLEETSATAADAALLRKIDKAVKSILPDSTVILFGSRARGGAAGDSDWDILVLAGSAGWRVEKKIYSALFEVELDENIIINVLVIEREDWDTKRYAGHPIKRNIENEGVLVA